MAKSVRTTENKRRRAKREAGLSTRDPLVKIDPGCLKAAIAAEGLSGKELARELRIPQQTLNSIVGSTGERRCRGLTRRHLARRLHVTERWLAGEEAAPDVPGPEFHGRATIQQPDGRLVPGIVLLLPDEQTPRVYPEPGGPILPPRVQLEAQMLVDRLRAIGAARDGLGGDAMGVLSLYRWRRLLWGDVSRPSAADADAFAVALGQALRLALSPGAGGRLAVAQAALPAVRDWLQAQLSDGAGRPRR